MVATTNMKKGFLRKKDMWLAIAQEFYNEINIDKNRIAKLRLVWRGNTYDVRDKVLHNLKAEKEKKRNDEKREDQGLIENEDIVTNKMAEGIARVVEQEGN